MVYFRSMPTTTSPIKLTALREKAGLTAREFARQLETSHTNVINWEKAGWITKSEFLPSAASILGVTIDELLGLPKTRKAPIPGGKAGQVFRQVAELPRRQQERIVAVVEDMLTAQKARR